MYLGFVLVGLVKHVDTEMTVKKEEVYTHKTLAWNPNRATQESSRVSREIEEAGGKCRQKP